MPPGGKKAGIVKGHSGDSRRYLPVVMRLLGARHARALGFGNAQARVIDAVGGQGPAVILARLRNIDFVTASRAVFMRPQLPGPGVQCGTLLVAMPVGPDFGARLPVVN